MRDEQIKRVKTRFLHFLGVGGKGEWYSKADKNKIADPITGLRFLFFSRRNDTHLLYNSLNLDIAN